MRRGIQREQQVRKLLELGGWWVCRAAGSFGEADLVALRRIPLKVDDEGVVYPATIEAWLVEVKSTAGGPYERFGPGDRQELLAAAEKAGAEAWLCWWPPRKSERWISSREWPGANAA